MRAILTASLIAALTATALAGCSSSSSSANSATTSTASDNSAAADNTAASTESDNTADNTASDNTASDNTASGAGAASSDASNPPVYPGAVEGTRPAGVGLKAPPHGVKSYSTSDDFAKVKAWYHDQLKGAMEVSQPGMEKTEAAFLVGQAASGKVVMVQSYQGKTWILIGPPM